jgi:hypothetical protein
MKQLGTFKNISVNMGSENVAGLHSFVLHLLSLLGCENVHAELAHRNGVANTFHSSQ